MFKVFYFLTENKQDSRAEYSSGIALPSKFHKLEFELHFYQYIKEEIYILFTYALKKHLGRKIPLNT